MADLSVLMTETKFGVVNSCDLLQVVMNCWLFVCFCVVVNCRFLFLFFGPPRLCVGVGFIVTALDVRVC